MLESKEWQKITGVNTAETSFVDEVSVPYLVVRQRKRHWGDDYGNGLVTVITTMEFYHDVAEPKIEEKIEKTLDENGIEYEKYEDYMDSERVFMTTYEFEEIIRRV